MKNIRLSIIIPVYNNANFTKEALKDLSNLPSDHEIIIVDNGSTDSTKNVIDKFINLVVNDKNKPRCLSISYPFNKGFGIANNDAYRLSKGKNVLFLNNDIRVKGNHRSWTESLILAVENKNCVAATQAGLLDKYFNFVKEGTNISLKDPLSYLSGWCLAGSKETFNKLILNHRRDENGKLINKKAYGPWNELFYPAYFEDNDLSFRCRKMGIDMKLINLPIHHFGRMTGRQLNLKDMYLQSREIFIQEWKEKLNIL